MEPPFWTTGPVPFRLLDALAIPRTRAASECLARLETDHLATIGGAPGSGRSTLAHQVARAWPGPVVRLDGGGMLRTDETAWTRELLGAWDRTRRKNAPDWDAATRLLPDDTLFVVDDAPDTDWLRQATEDPHGAYLLVRDDGDVHPDDVPEATARGFLRQRVAPHTVTWTEEALAETVRLAAGRPDALQRLGQACLQHAHGRIEEADVLEAASQVAHALPTHVATRLARLGGARARLLNAVARFPDETPTRWAERCGIEQRAAMVHLGRLVRTDRLLERTGRGTYRITSPLLEMHLRERHQLLVDVRRRS